MSFRRTRRTFLASALATTAAAAVGPAALGGSAAAAPGAGPDPTHAPWARARWIERHVRPPRFPDRWFDITTYGAVPGGDHDSSDAIRDAIRDCHEAGGGHVLVPSATFLTGPIHLLSNVDLHLADGAHLLFSTDPDAYLPPVLTRFEGVELYNYSPLIYALDQHDIAVTGRGTLDGQADDEHWWPWKAAATTAGSLASRPRPPPTTASCRWPTTASRSRSASSATATTCAPRSSSRTAAATC